jgi:hypothetical protein
MMAKLMDKWQEWRAKEREREAKWWAEERERQEWSGLRSGLRSRRG